MTIYQVTDNASGAVSLRFEMDDEGGYVGSVGGLSDWLDDLADMFPELTVDQIASKFVPYSKVEETDDDELGSIPAPKPVNIDFKAIGAKRTPKVKKADIGEIVKTDEDQRIIFGWAYVMTDANGQVYDKSGEFVDDVTELEKAAYDYVVEARMQSDGHRGTDHPKRFVGRLIESMVFTPEKMEKMGIPQGSLPTAWWVGFKVEDDEVWQACKRGERPAFSIHGSAIKEEVIE